LDLLLFERAGEYAGRREQSRQWDCDFLGGLQIEAETGIRKATETGQRALLARNEQSHGHFGGRNGANITTGMNQCSMPQKERSIFEAG